MLLTGVGSLWDQLGLLVGVLSPLVGAPLVVITLYLRGLREQQTNTLADMGRRIDAMERTIRDLLRSTSEFEREYATKEEWVRESMLARQGLERLTEMVTRIGTELETHQSVAADLGRATASMVALVSRLAERDRHVGGAGE